MQFKMFKIETLSIILIGVVCLTIAAGVNTRAFAAKGTINDIEVTALNKQLQILFDSDKPLDFKIFKLENPLRIALDIQDTTIEGVKFPVIVNRDPILQITKTQFGKFMQNVRLEIVLSQDATYRFVQEGSRMKFLLLPMPENLEVTGEMDAFTQAYQEQSEAFTKATNKIPKKEQEKYKPEEIVVLEQAPPEDSDVDEMFPDIGEPAPDTEEPTSPFDETPPSPGSPQPELPDVTDDLFSADMPASDAGAAEAEDDDDVGGSYIADTEWGAYLQGSEAITRLGAKRYAGKPISLDMKNADLLDLLRHIGQLSGFNIVVDPGVSGRVTIHLERVPWDQALDIILKNNGLGRTFEGNVMRVASLEKLKAEEIAKFELEQARTKSAPLYTEIVYLSYADAPTIGGLMQSHLTPGRGDIAIDERTNSLILTDVRASVEHMKTLIAILDRRTRQVNLNARIVSATKAFAHNIGFRFQTDYTADAAHGNTTRYNFPFQYGVNAAVNMPGSEWESSILQGGFSDILDTTFLRVALYAGETDGTSKTIANPKITTSDNQAAKISSGISIPVPRLNENGSVAWEYQDVLTSIEITPHITNDNWIDMKVVLTHDTVTPSSGFAPPPINRNAADSQVLIKDGDTFVIGGFKLLTLQNGLNMIPWVHKIPILGWLFKYKNNSKNMNDLLFFITPSILPDEPTAIPSSGFGDEESE